MILHANPFAVVRHNQWRLPRVVFHVAHIAAGVLAFAFAMLLDAPSLAPVLATGFALLLKCLWIDWHRTSGRLLHLQPFGRHDPLDVASDLGLALLGALLPPLLVALPAYYVLSLFNGT